MIIIKIIWYGFLAILALGAILALIDGEWRDLGKGDKWYFG